MNLECLANELLLDLFEYFDVINLFRAFTRLNHRFHHLLFIHLQRYYLDFRSISKFDFHLFTEQYLPLINDRVRSFRLSDDTETPHLPQMFLSSGYSINQFIHLKSLVIDHARSFDLLNQITSQCRQLTFLSHLSIKITNNDDPDENFRHFINNIWTLPKLSHCHLNIEYPYTAWLLQMSSISQSIRCLSLKNVSFNANALLDLFQHTPQLERLSFGNLGQFNLLQTSAIFSSLISLHIIVESSKQWMINLFQQFPRLCFLTIQMNHMIHIDGHEWQTILNKYFINLQVFRLKMTMELSTLQGGSEEQIDQLLDSYRSDYWIEQHHWFVQCDWWPMETMQTALIYTLPYAFDTFHYQDGMRSKSTSSNQFSSSAYDRVHTLHHINRKRDFSINCISSSIQFINIRHLNVKLPCDDNFWSIIPTLDRLTSIHVVLTRDLGYSQLQMLLDRAPRLYSLSFSHVNNFSMNSFNLHSPSVRRLEFFQDFAYCLRYFNTNECMTLARSSLASQCKVLMIDVASRSDILQLIQIMPDLQVLHIRCAQEQTDRYSVSEINNTLIKWLEDRLSSKCTFSNIRSTHSSDHISLWVNQTSRERDQKTSVS